MVRHRKPGRPKGSGKHGRKMKGGCRKTTVYNARHPRGVTGVRRKSCLHKK